MGEKFRTEIKDHLDISWYSRTKDIIEANAIIEWEVLLEYREWGIKNITPVVNKVTINAHDENTEENIEKILTDPDKFKIIEWPSVAGSSLCPREISYDEDTGIVEITF